MVKMKNFGVIVTLYLLLAASRSYETEDIDVLRLCISQNSCESCLEANSACAWCSDWSFSNSTLGKPRCNFQDRLKAFGCPWEEIRRAPAESVHVLDNLDFEDVISGQIPVQLKPQRIKIGIRPHSKRDLQIKYRPAKDYPLDLYYLMDLTWSMRDDKETLVSLGWNLTDTLGTFTNNFRLGFGSYADKPVMPFIFPGHEDNPCKSEHSICSPLYSFRHHLELTNDTQKFIAQVNQSSVTGNVDNLEGSLDGVVQAIVCGDAVRWAHQARKLMLVATDGYLHFAGEGKLGGVVNRPDFQCHLDQHGEYSLAKEFDYPSLAEVSRLLEERKVNLIFAVTAERRAEYQKIAGLLKEKANLATLTSNSSNILEIIENAYHSIVGKVVLRDNSTRPLHLRYFSDCGNEADNTQRETAECENVKEARIYDFRIQISVDECPRNESLWKQTIVVEDALASEASEVIIEVELLCGCRCKNLEGERCAHGTNECGLCKCDFGWSGESCDCDESSPMDNRLQCMAPNSEEICSRRGECVCGTCSCDPGYKGPFCECSPCDKTDGIECGGKGTCQCGLCNCLPGWEGNACQCRSGDEPCIAPGTNEICANHGYCDCGHCRCNATAADGLFYRGTYCESSASAGGSGLCVLYNPCVNASVENVQAADQYCRTNLTVYTIENTKTVDIENEHYCLIRTVADRATCDIPYVYEFQSDNTVTLKIGEKVCRTRLHAAFVPGIISGAVLLFGIISLCIWKFWVSIQDRREYAKFEQEQKRTVYALDENPLYKPATTQFRVPSIYNDD